MNESLRELPSHNKQSIHSYFGVALAFHVAIAFLLLFSMLPDIPWPASAPDLEEKPLVIQLQSPQAQQQMPPAPLPPIQASPPPPTPEEKSILKIAEDSLEPIAAIMPHLGPGMAESVVKQSSLVEIDGDELAEPTSDAQGNQELEQSEIPLLPEFSAPPLAEQEMPLPPQQQETLPSTDTPASEDQRSEKATTTLIPEQNPVPSLQQAPQQKLHQQIRRRQPIKKPLSLADIAQTFLSGTLAPEECRGDDNTNFWRVGDQTIRPDSAEWIKLNYLNKFLKHFNMTCNCNEEFRNFTANFDGIIAIPFEVLLDRNGFLLDAHLEPTTNSSLATIVLQVLSQASPYPPLPKSFPKDSMRLNIVFHVQGFKSLIALQKQLSRRKELLDKSRNPFYN